MGPVGVYVVQVLLVAGAYYGAAKLGLRLAYLNGAVTALWPPVGVGIAALVLFGPRLWPGIVIADLLVADYGTPARHDPRARPSVTRSRSWWPPCCCDGCSGAASG